MNTIQSDSLVHENRVLIGHFGGVQRRCSELVAAQAREIDALRAELILLRGELIARETALAFAHEDRAVLEATIPGLRRRISLARHVTALQSRIQEMLRERSSSSTSQHVSAPRAQSAFSCVAEASLGSWCPRVEGNVAALEASHVVADLVICKVGCVAHNFYCRADDHCRRKGRRCILAEPLAPVVVSTDVASGVGVLEPS